ncbi:hypothetical protein CHI05_07465 [Bacillus sp. 7788]|uniref:hypothetical protein n=1 Tax=Bacillus sp. 7788 TaxID=2021692 RepID=UPI000BA64B57|nr:hypothetical protein [Bacillus sp. 7788]PAC82345.1 hypothetical protein CHI05_07465 [Bacillus sp. 7788]
MTKESGFYIPGDEYYDLLKVLEYSLDKSKSPGWKDSLEKLLNELKANLGNNLEPWQVIWITKALLEYVPKEITTEED